MRRAAICVGMMLAVVECWPLLFAGGVAMPASAAIMPVPAARQAPGCTPRHRRAVAVCIGERGTARSPR